MSRAPVPHLTVEERTSRGKVARQKVPRRSHASIPQWTERPDPVELLESQAASRVAELVPIRYGRMLVSPFTFYRGAALLMASDLAGTPRSGLDVQLCGDAHLMNFGVYGSPERRLVFDINDFDETAPGPFEWDVKRLAASFAVALRDRGIGLKERRVVIMATVAAYRESMSELAGMTNLDVWYQVLDIESVLATMAEDGADKALKRAEANLAKARTRDSHQAYDKLTELVEDQPRIISDPPLIEPLRELMSDSDLEVVQAQIHDMFVRYRESLQSDRRRLLEEYRVVDLARKVVGVGSVGSRAWVVLMLGRDGSDPLFLQAKEAQTSVLHVAGLRKRRITNGQRVVEGQHVMQATSDIFLGWTSIIGTDLIKRDYYFRQLKDWKGSADVERLQPKGLKVYARICGQALARAHARSGDRIAIAAYLGSGTVFDEALADFAERYADQNEADFDALVAAESAGRVVVHRGL